MIARFTADLDALAPPSAALGIAVSGGPDSMALLLLAAATRHGRVEAATVDHGLRPESPGEAAAVAGLCNRLGVTHTVLSLHWGSTPATRLQERARVERYRALEAWLLDRELEALATAHHADDQAETMLMRLSRGAGVRGLAAMRATSTIPGGKRKLLRPLLHWRRTELEQLCVHASVMSVADPSNSDDRFERVRVRKTLAKAGWLDVDALGRSAAHLAAADEALDWAAAREWNVRVRASRKKLLYAPTNAPPEIRRRILARIIGALAREGLGEPLRGRELDLLLAQLEEGNVSTLRGVKCSGGAQWSFEQAAPRSS